MSDPFDPAACGFFVVPNSFHRLRISCWMNNSYNSSRPEPDVNKNRERWFHNFGRMMSKNRHEPSDPVIHWGVDTPMQVPLNFYKVWAPAMREHAKSLGKDWETQWDGSENVGPVSCWSSTLSRPFPIQLVEPVIQPWWWNIYIYIIIYRWEISHQTSVKTRTFNCHSWWHRRVNGHWYAQNWNERIHVRVS